MSYLYLILTFIIDSYTSAQSPYLSILVKMDSVKAESTRYKIEMKICEPKKFTERGDWFTHDTSSIDFASLKANEIDCAKYFDKGQGEPLTYNKEEIPFNKFEFSNQVFAWEHIFIFRISNMSSRGWMPEMYIVLPMKYKSFRTSIDLTSIEFQPGKVIFLTEYASVYDASKLIVDQSLKDHTGVEVKTFALKELLEGK